MRKFFVAMTFVLLPVLAGCSAEMSIEPPTIVANGFNRDHPGATVDSVQQTNSNGGTGYTYHYTDANGNKKTAAYDAQGNPAPNNNH